MALPRIVSFFIIYLFSCYEANEIQSARLDSRHRDDTHDSRTSEPITVSLEKSLHIIFEESYAKSISCQYFREGVYSPCKECDFMRYNETTPVIKINSVTTDMNTQWQCNDDKVSYSFRMRVKRAREVNLKIARNDVKFASTNESLDGVYNYICEEGYTVDLICESIYDKEIGSISMKYYDAQGFKILETDLVFNHNASLAFRQLMTSTNYSGSYVDCTYNTMLSGNNQDFTYRIIFTVQNKSASNDNFTVNRNNVKLIPTQSANNANEPNTYDYKYMKGEQLTATCENTKTLGDRVYGDFKPFFNNTNITQSDKNFKESMKMLAQGVSVDTKLYSVNSFLCYSDEDDILKAHVQFSVGPSPNPLVHGLRASDILLQYSKNYSETITLYQYTENEEFYLSCLADEGWTSSWVSENKQIPGFSSGNFTLKSEHNNASITCEAKQGKVSHRTMVVVFQLKVSNEDNGSSLGVIIGSVAGVLMVIVCAIYGCFWYTKKRDIGIRQERLNIDPSQSENYDYTYIEAGGMIENAYYCGQISTDYKVPQDMVNNSKNPAESHYSEIGDKNEKKTLTYDEPYAHLKKCDNTTLNNVNYENINQENSNKPYSNLESEIINMRYSILKSKNTNYENL